MDYIWIFVRDSSRRHALFAEDRTTVLAHVLLHYPNSAVLLHYPNSAVPVQYRVIMNPYRKAVKIGEFATLRKAKRVAETLAPMYLEVE